jgi:mannose-6-phosphate isomerase-like protein (cupin superfamily)
MPMSLWRLEMLMGSKSILQQEKLLRIKTKVFTENPRDVFMLVLQGEIEFTFNDGEKTIVKPNGCFVLRKHVKHKCGFKKMTIAVEGVYEKGL